jgi:hypothetical protein
MVIDLVVGEDLLFGLLHLHQLAEFGGLASLALANDICLRFEQADDLVGRMCVALIDALPGLADDLSNARDHRQQILPLALRGRTVVPMLARLDAVNDIANESAGLADDALRDQNANATPHRELRCQFGRAAPRSVQTDRVGPATNRWHALARRAAGSGTTTVRLLPAHSRATSGAA